MYIDVNLSLFGKIEWLAHNSVSTTSHLSGMLLVSIPEA